MVGRKSDPVNYTVYTVLLELPNLEVSISSNQRRHPTKSDAPSTQNRTSRLIVLERKDRQIIDQELYIAPILDDGNLVESTGRIHYRRQRIRTLGHEIEARRLAQVGQEERALLGPAPAEIRHVQRPDVARVVLRVGAVARRQARVEDAAAVDGLGGEEEDGQPRLVARGEFPGDADAVWEHLWGPKDKVVVDAAPSG